MASPLARLVQAVTPRPVGVRLHQLFDEEGRRDREATENRLPKVALSEKHIRNCEVVLDRSALLDRLPKHAVVAEIGVDHGEFSKQILRQTAPSALHLVDVWGSERYHSGLFELVTSTFQEQIDRGQVHVHRDLSVRAAPTFEDDLFDWIYIDTDHSYETTRDELRAFAPKVKRGGVIAGHDYVMGNWATSYRYGVIEAVHEFCVESDWEFLYLTASIAENQSFAIRRIGGD